MEKRLLDQDDLASIDSKLANKSDKSHTHTDYAPSGHTHNITELEGVDNLNKSFTDLNNKIVDGLKGKSDLEHNHDFRFLEGLEYLENTLDNFDTSLTNLNTKVKTMVENRSPSLTVEGIAVITAGASTTGIPNNTLILELE